MRIYRQLSELMASMPPWLQLLLGIGLVAYSVASIYGRVNLNFGARFFSRIPKERLRHDTAHIAQYTLIPTLITLGYLAILLDVWNQQ